MSADVTLPWFGGRCGAGFWRWVRGTFWACELGLGVVWEGYDGGGGDEVGSLCGDHLVMGLFTMLGFARV